MFNKIPLNEIMQLKIVGIINSIIKFITPKFKLIDSIKLPIKIAGSKIIICNNALLNNNIFSFIGLDFIIQKFLPSNDKLEHEIIVVEASEQKINIKILLNKSVDKFTPKYALILFIPIQPNIIEITIIKIGPIIVFTIHGVVVA